MISFVKEQVLQLGVLNLYMDWNNLIYDNIPVVDLV